VPWFDYRMLDIETKMWFCVDAKLSLVRCFYRLASATDQEQEI